MKTVTKSVTISRVELLTNRGKITKPVDQNSSINLGNTLIQILLRVGIPAIGHFGVLAVEWGELTIKHEDDFIVGDQWTYTWTGKPLPEGWPRKQTAGNVTQHAPFRLDKPLAAQIAEDDEL